MSRHDARHGRQGGRVVDFLPYRSPFLPGDYATLNLDDYGRDRVLIVRIAGGRRSHVRFASGAELTVADSLLIPEKIRL